MRVFVQELGAVARESIIEKIQPGDDLHAPFVTGVDKGLRRVESLDHLRIFLVPRRPLRNVLVHVPYQGIWIRPGMIRVKPHRIRKLGPIRQQAEASRSHDKRLAASGMETGNQFVHVGFGHWLFPKPHFVVDIHVDDQFWSGTTRLADRGQREYEKRQGTTHDSLPSSFSAM